MKRNRLRLWVTMGVASAFVLFLILVGTKVSGATGMPEFIQILGNNFDAFAEFLKNNLKILELIW